MCDVVTQTFIGVLAETHSESLLRVQLFSLQVKVTANVPVHRATGVQHVITWAVRFYGNNAVGHHPTFQKEMKKDVLVCKGNIVNQHGQS